MRTENMKSASVKRIGTYAGFRHTCKASYKTVRQSACRPVLSSIAVSLATLVAGIGWSASAVRADFTISGESSSIINGEEFTATIVGSMSPRKGTAQSTVTFSGPAPSGFSYYAMCNSSNCNICSIICVADQDGEQNLFSITGGNYTLSRTYMYGGFPDSQLTLDSEVTFDKTTETVSFQSSFNGTYDGPVDLIGVTGWNHTLTPAGPGKMVEQGSATLQRSDGAIPVTWIGTYQFDGKLELAQHAVIDWTTQDLSKDGTVLTLGYSGEVELAELQALETRINLELSQPVLDEAHAFEFLFEGDQTLAAEGGILPGSNPFVSGPGLDNNTVTYDSEANVTTLTLAGDLTVPLGPPDVHYNAGYTFEGSYREVLGLNWLGATAISVGDVACFFSYDTVTNAVNVVATNFSAQTVTLSDAAFLVVDKFPSLENLNSSNFPLSAMSPAPKLEGELRPGEATSSLVVPMEQDQFIVTRALITFSGASKSEPYQLAGGSNLSLWSSSFVPSAPLCDGDASGDGVVDPLDVGYVLARFGCPVGKGDPDCDAADVSGDGIVDPLDVGYVLARFGTCN